MANIEIVDYVPIRPANPFDEHVAALIAAGAGKAVEVECGDAEYKSVKRKFREAATNAGYSARIRTETHGPISGSDDDGWTITFTVAKRKPKDDAETSADEKPASATKTRK